jgi:hypothetical protein
MGPLDAFEAVALVASSRRDLLLRVHHYRLSPEELEDCYGQATLELLLGVRGGRTFSDHRHIANALELRFLSRIRDRQRALGGRSGIQAALAKALALGRSDQGAIEPIDLRADVEQLVHAREQLRLVIEAAAHLTADQRLALRSQLGGDLLSPLELCRWEGWSSEKHRKLAQRARARLRGLLECPVSGRASDERAGTDL